MRIQNFEYLFNRTDAFYLTKDVILFRKPLELWNEKTNESVEFKNKNELYAYVLDGKKVEEIITEIDTLYIPPLEGGRGASGSNTFSFGSAGSEKGNGKSLFPAYANVRIKTKNLESAMEEFRNKFKNENREWAYEVDEQGYVHQFVKGGKHSVAISSSGRNTMILHNHPSGGHFSDADLISTSMQRNSKGIVASGSKYDYVFQKGTHFKATQFIKAVKTAKMRGKDYDSAVDNWLKRNQKKYGFKYYKRKN